MDLGSPIKWEEEGIEMEEQYPSEVEEYMVMSMFWTQIVCMFWHSIWKQFEEPEESRLERNMNNTQQIVCQNP